MKFSELFEATVTWQDINKGGVLDTIERRIVGFADLKKLEDEGSRWKVFPNIPPVPLRRLTRGVCDVDLNIYVENGQTYIDKPKNGGRID